MSKLLILTRPELQAGFTLAGIETYAAPDVESAVEWIEAWLDMGEEGLLAIDEGLIIKMPPALMRRLEAAERLPYLAIPSGQGAEEVVYRRQRISELTRRVVGFHSIFKTDKAEEKET